VLEPDIRQHRRALGGILATASATATAALAQERLLLLYYLDMSKPRSGAAPIHGLPNPTRDTRKSVPGNCTDAASLGGGNLDALGFLPLLRLLLLRGRP